MAEAYRPPATLFKPEDYDEFYKLVGGDGPNPTIPYGSDNASFPETYSPVEEAERILVETAAQQPPPSAAPEKQLSEPAFTALRDAIKKKAVQYTAEEADTAASVYNLGEGFSGQQVVCKWTNSGSDAPESGLIGSVHFIADGVNGGKDVLSYWLFDTPDGRDIDRSQTTHESWTDILLLTESAVAWGESNPYGLHAESHQAVSDAEAMSVADMVANYTVFTSTDYGGASGGVEGNMASTGDAAAGGSDGGSGGGDGGGSGE